MEKPDFVSTIQAWRTTVISSEPKNEEITTYSTPHFLKFYNSYLDYFYFGPAVTSNQSLAGNFESNRAENNIFDQWFDSFKD